MKAVTLFFFLIMGCGSVLLAQYNSKLVDGRGIDPFCRHFEELEDQKPKEVLYGIHIEDNGDVYFSMNNVEWFKKLFKPGMALTTDIVASDRYRCGSPPSHAGLFRGYVIRPLPEEDFKKNMRETVEGHVSIKIGKVPPELKGREIEGNIVILYQNKVCYYLNFLDIDRAGWGLLPMGLYADTLLTVEHPDSIGGASRGYTYERKVQIVVPFEKNKIMYSVKGIQKIIDSLHLTDGLIRRGSIRAFSSVEGPESLNSQLTNGRARSMLALLRKLQPGVKNIDIRTAENWPDFYQDIKDTRFGYLGLLSRSEVKLKLLDKKFADSLENVLSKERISIVNIYFEKGTGLQAMKKDLIVYSFNKAIAEKNINLARLIQREVFDRVSDGRLPGEYLDKLEVPQEKTYLELLNDRAIFRYSLNKYAYDDVLDAFKRLKELDPGNGRVNYNFCAMSLFAWQYGDSLDVKSLLTEIHQLQDRGIDSSLVKRMMINYHVLQSYELEKQYLYDEKDSSVRFIKENYEHLALTDEDRFSLAKYFTFYSQHDWAEELIAGRIDKLDVSEDLLFYYVNLGFFKSEKYDDAQFRKVLLNASTINRIRFCRFFRSSAKGGGGYAIAGT